MNTVKVRGKVKSTVTAVSIMILFSSFLHGADISLTASNTKPDVGQTFTVTVNLLNAPPFAAWAEILKYDNTKLKLTAQATGSFTTFVPDSRTLAAINASGEVHATGYSTAGNNTGGNGSLGIFTFQTLSTGITNITTVAKNSSTSFGDALQPIPGTEVLPNIPGPLAITIGAPAITSALTATGTLNTAFSYSITATNTPTSYNATNLPAGLSVNTATGVISGTPIAPGTTSVTISATNAGGTGSATLSITISSGAGDLNSDGVVNITDLVLILNHFGQTSASTGWDPLADANGDGVVNVSDLTIVTSNFGKTYF